MHWMIGPTASKSCNVNSLRRVPLGQQVGARLGLSSVLRLPSILGYQETPGELYEHSDPMIILLHSALIRTSPLRHDLALTTTHHERW